MKMRNMKHPLSRYISVMVDVWGLLMNSLWAHVILGFLFWPVPALDELRRCFPPLISEFVALRCLSSLSSEHFYPCYEKFEWGRASCTLFLFHIQLWTFALGVQGELWSFIFQPYDLWWKCILPYAWDSCLTSHCYPVLLYGFCLFSFIAKSNNNVFSVKY